MKLRDLGVLLVSLALLVVPTVLGLGRSERAIADRFSKYGFDGERYVLEPMEVGVTELAEGGPWLELVAGWHMCCREVASGRSEEVLAHWLAWAEGNGWKAEARALEDVLNGEDPGGGALRFVVVQRDERFEAWPFLDADPLFATLVEPGVGRIAYRRPTFDAIWTGSMVEFRRSTGVAPSRP